MLYKNRLTIYALFIFSIALVHALNAQRKIRIEKGMFALAQKILMSKRYTSKEVTTLRNKIQYCRINKYVVSYKTASTLTNALTMQHDYSFLSTCEHILYLSINKFKNVEGFSDTLCRLLYSFPENYNAAKGALYEMSEALRHEQQGNKVLAFGKRVIRNKSTREFDLLIAPLKRTSENTFDLIECKNIQWNTLSPKSSYGKKLKKQLSAQKNIACKSLLNNTLSSTRPHYNYKLMVSQQPSPAFEHWLKNKNITYEISKLLPFKSEINIK